MISFQKKKLPGENMNMYSLNIYVGIMTIAYCGQEKSRISVMLQTNGQSMWAVSYLGTKNKICSSVLFFTFFKNFYLDLCYILDG